MCVCVCMWGIQLVFLCICVSWTAGRIYCFENFPDGLRERDTPHQSECLEAMSILLECLSCLIHMGICARLEIKFA